MADVGGIICPLATPLTVSGELAEEPLREHVEAIVADVDGVFVLGSSGELPWLSTTIGVRAAEVVIEHVNGRVPVYVGAGDLSTPRTLDNIGRLERLEPDYYVVAPPYYYPVEDIGLCDHYREIAEVSPRPMLLYNIPQNTGRALPAHVVLALAEHPNIVGLKDSAGDPFAWTAYLEASRRPDFVVMQGREQLMVASYWQGASGLISALANVAPRLLRKVQDAIRAGRPNDQILALQESVNDLATIFEHGYWLCALKAALEACGFAAGPPTRPLSPLDDGQRARIASILARHREHLTTLGGVGP